MGWQESFTFKTICRLVLISFYFQTVNPASFGYGPNGFRWPVGFNEAAADTTPATPASSPSPSTPTAVTKAAPVFPPQLAPDDYLGSTVEANTTDPYITQKATELNHDPALIFAFVRDEIGNEVYKGSLRGARGTLWSKAGNALDKASLMIALLRASNIPARYAAATLPDDKAKQIINSMFKMPLNVVGCPDENALRAEPDKNADLLAEAREHYWVEFGAGFETADPSFTELEIGTPAITAVERFNQVPDDLRHKVTVRLKREYDAPLGGPNDRDTKAVLEHTFTSVELVGKPLSIGHFVNSSANFWGQSHNYSPYLLVGQGDSNIADDEMIRGEDYQETFSLFGGILGSQILSGLFVEYEVFNAQGNAELYGYELLDRVGIVARENGEKVTVGGTIDGGPSITENDVATVNILPGLQNSLVMQAQFERLSNLQNRFNSIKPMLDKIPITGPETDAQKQIQNEAVSISRNMAVVQSETVGITFTLASDKALEQLQQGYLTKAFYPTPRLIVSKFKIENNTLKAEIDLLKNTLEALPFPGQIASLRNSFEIARGLIESTLEGSILKSLYGLEVDLFSKVIENLQLDNSLTVIESSSQMDLDALNLSSKAKSRISNAVKNNKVVFTPEKMVNVGGKDLIAWLEVDKVTGHVISVNEDGSHFAAGEYALILNSPGVKEIAKFIGAMHGFSSTQLVFIGKLLDGVNNNGTDQLASIVKQAKVETKKTMDQLAKALGYLKKTPKAPKGFVEAFVKGFKEGVKIGFDWINRNLPFDPQVFSFLSSDLAPVPATVLPNAQAGISVKLPSDTLFTVPVHGAEIPSVFKAQIQNTGPSTDTFKLAFSNVPAGYKAQSSIPEVTIPAGHTAEVGVCIKPESSTVPPAGTTVPFKLDVISTRNPGVKSTGQAQVEIPDLHEASLTLDRSAVSVKPGETGTATLSITSSGNVAEQLTLQAQLPNGVQLSGLPVSVTLAAGETKSFPVTVQTDAGLSIGQSLDLVINADLTGAPQPSQRSATLRVNLRSAQGVTIDNAIQQAQDGSNTQLPGVLSDLQTTLEQWAATPTNTSYCERAKLQVDNLSKLVAGDALLAGYASEVSGLRSLAQSCNLAGIQTLLPPLFESLAEASALGVVAAIAPSASVTQPGSSVTANLTLKNKGKKPANLHLALANLPNGLAAAADIDTLSLAAGETTSVPITLTPANSGRFGYQAVASVDGFAKTVKASGLLISANASVNVMSVSGTPPFVAVNGTTRAQAVVANTAGIDINAKASLTVKDANDQTVYQSATPIPVTIAGSGNAVSLDLDVLSTQGWAEGQYSLQLILTDAANRPIPGGQGEGSLSVGAPVKAVVSASPVVVPPGSSLVNTSLQVTPAVTGLGGSIGLAPTDPSLGRINWAAARQGASISVNNPGNINGTIGNLIDELQNGDPQSNWIGVNWNASPAGSFLLDLGQTRSIDTLQFHIWDGDDRFGRYKVEGSLDGQTFFTVADKSAGEFRGLQHLTFPATDLRYLKISGLFDSRDGSTFYLYDEIQAIGDASAQPMAPRTVTLTGVDNAGPDYKNGKKVRLNAGIYEVTRQSGAISWYSDDSGNNGKAWSYGVRASMPLKSYQADPVLWYASDTDVENAVGTHRFKLYVPAETDVYFWVYDTNPGDNRGEETFEIKQVSGPNDSLPVRIRDAMTRSVLWEQADVAAWNNWTENSNYDCFGCHVQAQASSGLDISHKKLPELPFDRNLQQEFFKGYRAWQNKELGWVGFDVNRIGVSQTSLWAWAVAKFEPSYFDLMSARFVQALDWLLTKRNDDGTWTDTGDGRSDLIYTDGAPAAGLTANNITSMAKALELMAGHSIVEFLPDEFSVNGAEIVINDNRGPSIDISFDATKNVTGVRVTISDTYAGNGNFVLNELEAFSGHLGVAFNGASANFEQSNYPIADSIDGVKNKEENGWAYFPRDSRNEPASGVWRFADPVSIDSLRITEFYPNHQLKKFKIEVTTDPNPSLDSQFVDVTGVKIGYRVADRAENYRGAITKAANTLSSANWPFARSTRTTAQTIIGLNAALPYLNGIDLTAALERIEAAAQHLRNIQHNDGSWSEDDGGLPQALPSAHALEALLLRSQNSSDPAIVAGAEYLMQSQLNDGSWKAPNGLSQRLASTTWVQIALPTIFENLASVTLGVDHRAVASGNTVPQSASFNPAVSSATTSSDESKLHWDALLNSDNGILFSLSSQLTGMQPGEVREISRGTTVDYASVGGNGHLNLPPLLVAAQHILKLSPASRSAVAGQSVSFNVSVQNLLNQPDQFALSITGLPDGSYTLPESVDIAAGATGAVTLTVNLPANTGAGELGFTVNAVSTAGVKDFALGNIAVSEAPAVGDTVLDNQALDLRLTPPSQSAGQGTFATYTVRLFNAGNVEDTYTLAADLPEGFSGVFSESAVTLSPGLSNFRDVRLTVTPPVGTTPGNYAVLVSALSNSNAQVNRSAVGQLNVSERGVSVVFLPNSDSGNSSLLLRVTNTGSVQDIFDLTLGGAASVSATLASSLVDLFPGSYQDIAIAFGDLSWSLPGNLALFGQATSQANNAVKAVAETSVAVAERKALDASANPASKSLADPGSADFAITVQNTGNIEDSYSATIVAKTGSIQASLQGLDGNPTQQIALFRLPGLAAGSLSLTVSDSKRETGTVKVEIVSTTDSTIRKTVTLQLTVNGTDNQAPIANAGTDKNVATSELVTLDGTASSDPDGNLLSDYRWRFVSVPDSSGLQDSDLLHNGSPNAQFTPDVAGLYRVELIVSDGQLDSEPDTVDIVAAKANVPPNANAGLDQTVEINTQTLLDGSQSVDPDGGPGSLQYAWRLNDASQSTHVTLLNANQAKATMSADTIGDYGFTLRVFDGKDAAENSTVVHVTRTNLPPVADAGVDSAIELGKVAPLNASGSRDNDTWPQPLTYAWHLVSIPSGSHLTDAAIQTDPADLAKALFIPDVLGDYVLQLSVSDGQDSATDNVLVKALPALRYQEVSDLIPVTSSALKSTLDRVTRKMTSSATLTLRNASSLDVKAPIRLMFDLGGANVVVVGAKIDETGRTYLEVPNQLLKPGDAISVDVQFVYASTVKFTYATKVFGGVAR
ncbi:PKD domain-containing protein [Methylomonas sp. EFPC3]|uniref:PKD domain-containing protein n=1 Tax=Methylomonas sp. EFPC3 TaxID=3021710 RepID=UPI002416ED46|nr:PKD domain-containing protein [Methylomonas sp. EFPC3]WFP48581.1 PKD domain-containing protein [Methylomonas sp. EFPC3]